MNPGSSFDRRTLLRRGAALSGGAVALSVGSLGFVRPAAAADEALAPFHHGVASGDPTPTAVVIWTCLTTSAPSVVAWEVASDLAFTAVLRSGRVTTEAARDHTVKVDVTGLPVGTWLFYRFTEVATGKRSLVGRTRTAPLPGSAAPARFGVVSCSNWTGGYFNAYGRLADRDDLDVVFHLGDYLYEYANGTAGGGTGGNADGDRYGPEALRGKRDHVPADEICTAAGYRARHAEYKLDPDLRRLHQLYPWITIWDDHETCDNSARDSANNHQPDEGDYQVRKDAARRAYCDWMPIRTDDPAKIYRSFTWGSLMDLVFLDTRLEGRDDQVGMTGATILDGAAIDAPDRHLISPTQMTWLKDRLSASKARGAAWQVIGQQVIVGQWNGGGLPALPVGLDNPIITPRTGGNALNPDQWDGYTADRTRLFDHFVDAEIPNPVVLTGDVHSAWALDLTPDPYDPLAYNPVTGEGALGVEFVVTSITSASLGETAGDATVAAETAIKADNPHVKLLNLTDHGYTVLDVTAARAQADFYVVDTVLEPTTTPATLDASWETLVGSRHVTAAAAAAPVRAAAGNRPPATLEAAPSTTTTTAPLGSGATAGVGGGTSLPATGAPAALAPAGLVLAGLAAGLMAVRRRAERAPSLDER